MDHTHTTHLPPPGGPRRSDPQALVVAARELRARTLAHLLRRAIDAARRHRRQPGAGAPLTAT